MIRNPKEPTKEPTAGDIQQKPLPAVEVGDKVRLKTDIEKEWSQSGVVQATSSTPCSFVVKCLEEKPSDGTTDSCRLSTKKRMTRGTNSTLPDCSVITHNTPGPAGCESETTVETHTPFKVTRSGRVVEPVVKSL